MTNSTLKRYSRNSNEVDEAIKELFEKNSTLQEKV